MEFALRLADRYVVLEAGELVAPAPPSSATPSSPTPRSTASCRSDRRLGRALRPGIDSEASFPTTETGKISIKVINHDGDQVLQGYEVGASWPQPWPSLVEEQHPSLEGTRHEGPQPRSLGLVPPKRKAQEYEVRLPPLRGFVDDIDVVYAAVQPLGADRLTLKTDEHELDTPAELEELPEVRELYLASLWDPELTVYLT